MTLVALNPPAAERRLRLLELHGERLVDEYFWLRFRDDPAVFEHLKAEHGYSEAMLEPTRSLQERLYAEMLGRIKQTDLSVPYLEGEYWYYSRTEEGKQYPIYCRKREHLETLEEPYLDLNQLASGKSYVGLGVLVPSPSGRYLAYSIDPTGFREFTLRIKDLGTGADLGLTVERAGSFAWTGDDSLFFYTTEDDAKRAYRVFRSSLAGEATLVYEEPDQHFRLQVDRTRSRAFVLLNSVSHTTSEVRYLPASDPLAEWRIVAPRVHDREYDLDHTGDRFFIRVNDTGRNFRVVTAPTRDPAPEHWTEVLPHRADVMVEAVDCFAGHWVVWERADGLPRIRVTQLDSGQVRYVELDEPVYEVYPGTNRQFEIGVLRYSFESFVTPGSVFDYDVARHSSTLLKRREVLGGYDPAHYVSERLHAVASDGTRIPVSLVRRRDRPSDRPSPMLLTGYGAYGIPYPVTFTSNRLSLLDRGMIVAVAHVRGGGELGRPWHDQGRMAHKMNSFTDFIAAADHLVETGRTSSDQLAIEGGSAGGLLMGAVLNLRPELCRVAVLQVPFVDVINTMLDASLPLTVGEYEEWGDPVEAGEYQTIRRYCPYTNLRAGPYPAMLVRTSLNDSQVMYWEPAKYVAKLRGLKADEHPLLLTVNFGAGHVGASGRYDRLREIALDYGFVLWQLGIEVADGGAPG